MDNICQHHCRSDSHRTDTDHSTTSFRLSANPPTDIFAEPQASARLAWGSDLEDQQQVKGLVDPIQVEVN
jgi:hypothetical protein